MLSEQDEKRTSDTFLHYNTIVNLQLESKVILKRETIPVSKCSRADVYGDQKKSF
jgi:hypothetical protein